MKCPVCKSTLSEKTGVCPECKTDLSVFEDINKVSGRLSMQRNVVILLGVLLIAAVVVIGTGVYPGEKSSVSQGNIVQPEDWEQLQQENKALKRSIKKLEKQLEAAEVVSPSSGKEKEAEDAQPEGAEKVSTIGYTVSEGESLWTIAKKHYKDGSKYVKIAADNDIENPDMLQPGKELIIKKGY